MAAVLATAGYAVIRAEESARELVLSAGTTVTASFKSMAVHRC